MRFPIFVGDPPPPMELPSKSWTDKYLGSDHHYDRHARSVVQIEDVTGRKYVGNKCILGLGA